MLKHESKIKWMLKEEVNDGRTEMRTKSLKAKEEHLHLDKVMVLKMSDSFKIEKSISDAEKWCSLLHESSVVVCMSS